MTDSQSSNPEVLDDGDSSAVLAAPVKRARRGSRKAAASTTAVAAVSEFVAAEASPPQPADAVVLLPSDLGIEQTQDLRAQLAECFERSATVVLDASAVQRVHTAAMQLFVMFCRDRRAVGHETEWRHPSSTLQTAASVMGVINHLQISRDPS